MAYELVKNALTDPTTHTCQENSTPVTQNSFEILNYIWDIVIEFHEQVFKSHFYWRKEVHAEPEN